MPKKNKVKVDVIIDDKGTMKKSAVGAHSVDRRLKGAARTSSNASKNFSKMAQGISGGLVPAYATLAASLFALDAVYRALSSAADLRILKEGQIAFAKSTGQAMNAVAGAIQRATEFQVSFKEASQASAIAASAGFGTSQIVALGKAANDAAKVLGRSVPDAFDRLVRGVVKAEPEVLDELGIILRLDDAAEKYALQMGLTASELTVFEKQQAVLNDVLDQAEQKFGAVASSIDPNPWTQLGVALEKVKDTFSIFISNILEPIATFLSGNATAAVAAMGVFIASILRGLIPSYREQAAKFAESQNLQQAEIDQTIAKINELKQAKMGATEALGVAEGGAQKLAGKAAPADRRTTLGRLQQGKVISARSASKEIVRIEKLKNGKIEGMTKKQTLAYKNHLKTIVVEQKVSTKKMEFGWKLFTTNLKLGAKSVGLTWKSVMMGMQRVTTIASRAMSIAMSAMGWIGMLTLLITFIKDWVESNKEVDEVQKRIDESAGNLNKTYKDLEFTFKQVIPEMETIRKGWVATEQEVAFYSNTLKNIPVQDTIDLLKMLGDEAVPEELRKTMEGTFEAMKKIVPTLADINKEMNAKELKTYVEEFQRFALAMQEIDSYYSTATEAEIKYNKALKDRIQTLVKSNYKKEIRELVTLVGNLAAINKFEMESKGVVDQEQIDNLTRYKEALMELLEVRKLEIQAQADSLEIGYKQSLLYKYQIREVRTLALETAKNVKKQEIAAKLQTAREAVAKVPEASEWERQEAAIVVQRLEYEQLIHEAQIAHLEALEDRWIQMSEVIRNSTASGLQKGIEGMLKGDMNLGEAISAMATTMGDAMAKQLSQDWTESIMGMLPPSAADKARAQAEFEEKNLQDAIQTKREEIRKSNLALAAIVKTTEETWRLKAAPAINVLVDAIVKEGGLTASIIANTEALTLSQSDREAVIRANNPGAFNEQGELMPGTIQTAVGDREVPAYPAEGSTLYNQAKTVNEELRRRALERPLGTSRDPLSVTIVGGGIGGIGGTGAIIEEIEITRKKRGERESAVSPEAKKATDDFKENVKNAVKGLIEGYRGGGEAAAPKVTIANTDAIGEKMKGALGGLLGQLGGMFSGMFSGGGGGGLVGGLISAFTGATGGYVTKRGIQGFAGGGKVRGSKDTVPAMLTPGEYVLTPGQMRSMGQGSTIVNVNMGEGGGTTTSVRSDRAEAAKFGRAIASAVNHEIMKQKRAGGKLWMPGTGNI